MLRMILSTRTAAMTEVTSMSESTKAPVVIITGGLSGIGEATAVAFARLGARLVLCDLSLARQDAVVDRVHTAGGTALAVAVDVRDPERLQSVAHEALAAYGRIDALVVSAGIADQSTVSDGDPRRWQAVVETNVLGTMYACRAVLPTMRAQERGDIFLVASVSGRETYVGEPAYIASKWGQVGFAHALRQEVMDDGVRVSLVEPGLVDSPLTRDNPVVRPLLLAAQPLVPDDVAAAIVFAFQQPPHVLMSELTVRPLRQRLPDLSER
jgi:NADP-dependent 3-hydroxy acid dehydrogenase YdfG